MRVLGRGVAVLSLLTAAVAPVGAANPRITLSVAEATAQETLLRLSEAADVVVRLYEQPVRPGAPARPEARASFTWKDVPFSKAVREVCERYQLRPSRTAGGYVLFPGPQAPLPEPKRVGLFERDGMRFFARSVQIYENRQLAFDGGDGHASSGLQVSISADLGGGDSEKLAGFTNVVARDDLGNVVGQRGDTPSGYGDGGLLPDEWSTTVSIPMVHPKATRLTWLEGDLMAYRTVKALRVEIPLPPPPGKLVEKRAGDAAFFLSRWQATPDPTAPEEDDQLFPVANRGAGGPSMRVRVYTPAGSGLRSRWGGWGMHPYLVTESGKIFTSTATSTSSGSDGNVMITQSNLTFPQLPDAPAKLVWDLVERADPVKLFTVRLTNIPLPPTLPFNPAAARPQPAPNRAPGGGTHPFHDRAGGSVISRVALPGGVGVNGELDLGLAPRQDTGFGPLRWVQLEVTDGVARLENVRPGAYRLMRRFRPRDGAQLPAAGRWTHEDVQITVTAGAAAEPAPLTWTVGPPAPPKPAPRPAAKPAPRR